MRKHNFTLDSAGVFLIALMSALKQDIKEAGYSIKTITEELSIDYKNISNQVNPNVGQTTLIKVDYLRLLKKTKAKHTMKVLGRETAHHCLPTISRTNIGNPTFEKLTEICSKLGTVANEALEAYKDGRLDKKEREKLQHGTDEIIMACQELQARYNQDFLKGQKNEKNT